MGIPLKWVFSSLAEIAGKAGGNQIEFGIQRAFIEREEMVPAIGGIAAVGTAAIEETPMLRGVKVIAESGSLGGPAFIVAGSYGEGATRSFLPSCCGRIALCFIGQSIAPESCLSLWSLGVFTNALQAFIPVISMIIAGIAVTGFTIFRTPDIAPCLEAGNTLPGTSVTNALIRALIAMVILAQWAKDMRGAHRGILSRNLMYVAATRAQHELRYITSELLKGGD
jgi:hypothetical protein